MPIRSIYRKVVGFGGSGRGRGGGHSFAPQMDVWFQYCHDAQHSGHNGRNNRVYFGCADGRLYCFDLLGNILWSYPAIDAVDVSPTVGADGTVYFCTENVFGPPVQQRAYAINPDGTLKWSILIQRPGITHGSLAIGPDGTIYIPELGPGGNLYAVNPDGTLKWTWAYPPIMLVNCGTTIAPDGTVYLPTNNRPGGNGVYAINPDGSLKWFSNLLPAFQNFNTPVALAKDGTVYAACGLAAQLFALDPDDGSVIPPWPYFFAGAPDYAPSVGPDGTIYQPYSNGVNGFVDAIDPVGNLLWTANLPGAGIIYSTPAIKADNTVLYVGSTDNNLYCIDRATGAVIWTFPTGNWIAASPAIGPDGVIYVGSYDNFLYAVNPGGTLKWRTLTLGPNVISSSVAIV